MGTDTPDQSERAPAAGMRVRCTPEPIPGYPARWAGMEGAVAWARDGNVRVDLDGGEHVTCGPGDVTLLEQPVLHLPRY